VVVLVVAADESVMPQTREHFEICRLLQVPSGLIVVTKADLVDAETLELVRLEVRDLVNGSFLESAPILDVSARTGAGIAALRATLAAMAREKRPRPAAGIPRLPVDRVFSMRGFGTVITGTLVSGRLALEEELVLLPSERVVKVRGLQVHGEKRDEAVAGQRAAVNLGGVDVQEVARGETLTRRGGLTVTRRLDASLDLLRSARPLRHGARVRFHQGTSELLGRIAISDGAEIPPGRSAHVRIRLESPAVLTRGDRFILRAYSPAATIAGGTVLDPSPPRTGVRTAAGRARFARLQQSDAEALRLLIEESGTHGLPVEAIGSRAGVRADRVDAAAAELVTRGEAVRAGAVLVSAARILSLQQSLVAALGAYHTQHPLLEGMPREEARERFFARAPLAVFELVIGSLVKARQIVARDRLALATHRLALSDEEARARDVIEQAYRHAGLKPPDKQLVAAQAGVQADVVDRVTALLVRQKILARVDDLVFHETALRQLKDDVRALRRAGQPATIDVGTFKDRFGITRKFAIPLLEYLDRERVTRRVGDSRTILGD